jgi:hypothetical protein
MLIDIIKKNIVKEKTVIFFKKKTLFVQELSWLNSLIC